MTERRGQPVHERAARVQVDGVAYKMRACRHDLATTHYKRAAIKRAAINIQLAAIDGHRAAQRQPV